MTDPIQMFNDRILMKEVPPEKMTKGGIVLPEQAQPSHAEGIVVAHGPGRYDNGVLVPMQVCEGDRLIFAKRLAVPLTINGEDYLMIDERNVFGAYAESSDDPIVNQVASDVRENIEVDFNKTSEEVRKAKESAERVREATKDEPTGETTVERPEPDEDYVDPKKPKAVKPSKTSVPPMTGKPIIKKKPIRR